VQNIKIDFYRILNSKIKFKLFNRIVMDIPQSNPITATTSVKQFFDDPANHSGIWLQHFKSYTSIPARAKDKENL
jgi:hypothetical protein